MPFSSVLAAIFFRERTGPLQIAGMAVAFAGIYIIAGAPELTFDALHLTLTIASALAFAAASIQIKMLGPINGFVLNAWMAVLAAPQMLLASLILESGQLETLAAADWRGWSAMVFTTVNGGVHRLRPLVLPAGPLPGEPHRAADPAGAGLRHVHRRRGAGTSRLTLLTVLAGAALTLIGVAIVQFRPSTPESAHLLNF